MSGEKLNVGVEFSDLACYERARWGKGSGGSAVIRPFAREREERNTKGEGGLFRRDVSPVRGGLIADQGGRLVVDE